MTRKEAIAEYKDAVRSDADARALLSGDLFYLLLYGLGRTDINNNRVDDCLYPARP
jgi:hypothetical protein